MSHDTGHVGSVTLSRPRCVANNHSKGVSLPDQHRPHSVLGPIITRWDEFWAE